MSKMRPKGTNEPNNLTQCQDPRNHGGRHLDTCGLRCRTSKEGGSLAVWIISGDTLLYKSTQQRLLSGLSNPPAPGLETPGRSTN